MGLIARAIEAEGLSTVLVMMNRGLAEKVQPPRVTHVQFPFGRPMGEPGNADQQRVIIEDALGLLESAEAPGAILTLPYRWRREDYAEILRDRAAGVGKPKAAAG